MLAREPDRRIYAGMLVAIEGIDGAGKGTLTAGLKTRAQSQGLSVATLSFPRYEQTHFSRLIAEYLNGDYGALDEVAPRFAALLYAGDRFESRSMLNQMLASNDVVICDRYVASNMAYQGARLDAAERPAFVEWLARTEFETFGLPRPALTLLLATDTATADALVARKAQRSYTQATRDLHEAAGDLMARVAAAYVDMAAADPETWRPVQALDADGALRPPGDIADAAWSLIADRL